MSDKEELQKAIDASSSWRGVLLLLGKSASGSSIKRWRAKADELGLDVAKLEISRGKHIVSSKKRELSDILVEDSTYSSGDLKKRLIREEVIEDKCSRCGQPPIWHGEPLTLQLDHINGNHRDNRIENLRVLCPHCHTQTSTWGTKKRINFIDSCEDCGADVSRLATKCIPCANIARGSEIRKGRPALDELKTDIKALRSFVAVGRKYSVSDNAIRNWLRDYGLSKDEIKDLKK